MAQRERSWWGWGLAEAALGEAECGALASRIRAFLPLDGHLRPVPPVPPLPASRLRPPDTLAAICRDDPLTRAAHAHGKAYRDVVRNLRGELERPPDLVAYPRGETDVTALLDWAAVSGTAVVPFGGGTSVVGGVEYRGDLPWLSIDLTRLEQVLEVDTVGRAARIEAGVLGPALEDRLRPYDLTLRHFPQSFEFSTLGGWLATRAGGHYATGHTHIDDLVESLRVVTPAGVNESLRVPASGAGPSPDRLFLGSEGILGIIVQAWVRLRRRPRFRARSAVRFADYADAVAATRAVAQSGLQPSNCRLLDPVEGMLNAGVTDGSAVLLLGFESASAPVDADLTAAAALCAEHHGSVVDSGATGRWRESFLRAPYLRDAMARLGLVVETFETATTWDRFPALHAAVTDAVATAAVGITGSSAVVTCRFTHVYPDGPAPYFTVIAAGRRGSEIVIWDQLKAAASEALLRHGATITHHHAVGRDHRPWYDRQRPEPFGLALRAAKGALDPQGILNPGVLLDP
jgi:alkyldihydroxyacetonephosphate synthase